MPSYDSRQIKIRKLLGRYAHRLDLEVESVLPQPRAQTEACIPGSG